MSILISIENYFYFRLSCLFQKTFDLYGVREQFSMQHGKILFNTNYMALGMISQSRSQ